VALDLLKNVNISAGGVLPMCQDTGTAIVMGKRGQNVLTSGQDEAHIARGVFDAYTRLNLRYSQMAPLTMWDEKNTGSNLPAQIELYATDGDAYKFLFMAKGGGSANKSYLYQETKAVLNPTSMMKFWRRRSAPWGRRPARRTTWRSCGRRPVRGVRAEDGEVRLGPLPRHHAEAGLAARQRLPRRRAGGRGPGADPEHRHRRAVRRQVLLPRRPRIRLPRHAPSLPIAIAVSCSADRQALGKITRDGVFLEQLETEPGHFLPETTDEALLTSGSARGRRRRGAHRPGPPDGGDPLGSCRSTR